MSGLELLATLLVVVGAGLVVVAAWVGRRSDAVAELLAEAEGDVAALDAYHQQLAEPLTTRLLRPVGRALAGRLSAVLPREHMARLRRRLVQAGLAPRVAPEDLLAIEVASAALGVALAVVVASTASGLRSVALALLLVFVGLAAPRAWVDRRRAERVAAIERDLPDILDLIAISVRAGAGLEAAMRTAVERFPSPLTEELARTLREIELGLSRREALDNLRERVAIPDIDGLVLAIQQADALGMPLSPTLRAQADELRRRRRQRARERAATLPVRMLFPLVLFILPALFIVVLGPAAIEIARVLLR